MRKYNKSLNTDIKELKRLHIKKDKAEFKKRKLEVMAKHKISRATVYREMKKDVPGMYKKPQYIPPVRQITEKEKELVSGMLFKQMTIEQIRAEMEKQTGESYSWDRIDAIRKEAEKQAEKNNAAKIPDDKIIDMRASALQGFGYESPHGMDMKDFLSKALGMEKIDEQSYVTIPINGYGVRIGSDCINDIHRMISNSAASLGKDTAGTAKMTLKHLAAELVRKFAMGRAFGPKDLTDMHKILGGYNETAEKDMMNFEYVVEIVKAFAPDTSREDIVLFTRKYAKSYKDFGKGILPEYGESLNACAELAWRSM